jgi:hypothetical protein
MRQVYQLLLLGLLASHCQLTEPKHQQPVASEPTPAEQKPAAPVDPPVKLRAFANVEDLRNFFSSLGYVVRPWKQDEMGWSFSTPYKEFGTPSPVTTLQNNLAFYASSENDAYIQKVKLILNLNNRGERKSAVLQFTEQAQLLLKKLNVVAPGLEKSVNKFKPFEQDLGDCRLVFATISGPQTDEYSLSVVSN